MDLCLSFGVSSGCYHIYLRNVIFIAKWEKLFLIFQRGDSETVLIFRRGKTVLNFTRGYLVAATVRVTQLRLASHSSEGMMQRADTA